MRNRKLFALSLALSGAFRLVALAIDPVGMETLLGGGADVCADTCWTNENCDGMRVRIVWADYETSEGVYLWNQQPGYTPCLDANHGGNNLDAAISMAAATHKFVGISISAGVSTPEWVYTAGVYKFPLDASDTSASGTPYMPLLWDTIYQTKWHNFLTAYAAHMKTLPGYANAVKYIVMGGIAKVVDMRTWCQNLNASVSTTGGSYTDTGAGSGFCKVHSTTAHFLTHTGQTSGDIVGKTITDVADGSGLMPGNANVCDHNTAGCPADPTDTDVYVVKNTRGSVCVTACTNQPVIALEWLANLGEFYQMDQAAISPPPGYAGLAGTANPNGMTGATGNFCPAVETIEGWFFPLFPDKPVIFTSSPPYPTSQGQPDLNNVIRPYNSANFPPSQYGEMVISEQASCPPHDAVPGATPFATSPRVSQAINGTNNAQIYGSNVCSYYSQVILEDLLGEFFDKRHKCAEIYQPDVVTADPAGGNPYIISMVRNWRAKVNLYNPQPEHRALFTRRTTP